MATTPQTNSTLEQIAQVIRENDDFVICGHVSPDCDCLGSQLALYHALRASGKRAACVLARDEPLDASLSFLPGASAMMPASLFNGTCGVFVGVDVPTRQRIGDASALLDASRASITIDHHASDTTMCDYVYVDPDSASASMLVWEVVKLLVDVPPFESALCAYAGLVTDTGSFRFQNSDVAAFRTASELVGYGVDPAWVATRAFQNRTLASLKLESLAIDRLRLFAEGMVAVSWVAQSDFERLGALKSDAEPLIDSIRELRGARLACILREQDGHVRGSLRSKDSTDVSGLARDLGGGGHAAAAGFSLDMPIEQAVEFMGGKLAGLLASEG